jgi:hypothetical protein
MIALQKLATRNSSLEESNMSSVTLGDQVRAVRVQFNFERVLFLDAVWTKFLEHSGSISDDNVNVLHSLAEEMRRALTHCAADAEWLDFLLRSKSEYFDQTFNHSIATIKHTLSDTQRHQIARSKTSGGIGTFTRYTRAIPDIVSAERVSIGSKIQMILARQYTPGDLSKTGEYFLKGGLAVVALAVEPIFGAYIALEVLKDCF